MKPGTLLKLYPKTWRDRYGDEFVALLEKEGTGPRVVMNVLAGAFDAWMSPRSPSEMALDGPFGPAVLFTRTGTTHGLHSASHWRHILAAIVAGLLVQAATIPLHGGEGPVAVVFFLTGFLAANQWWVLRHFSRRTRVAAAAWTLVIAPAASFAILTLIDWLVRSWLAT